MTDEALRISQLANGVRVATLRLPGRTGAAATLAWGAGTHQEGPNEKGLAHLAEHVLFPDDPQDLAAFDAAGGQFNAWNGAEYSLFQAHTPARQLSSALKRLSRHLARGAHLVDEAVFRRECTLIDRERFAEGDPTLDRALAQCLAPPAALAETESEPATPDTLRRFIDRELHGGSLCIGIAGDLDHAEVLQAVKPLGSLPPQPDPPTGYARQSPIWRGGLREHITEGGAPGLLWLLPSPPRNSAQGDALAVAERALCGQLNAPLFHELRASGLAYGLHSVHERWSDGGVWALQVICVPEVWTRVSAAVHSAMNEAVSRFSREDLEVAWSSLAASTQLDGDNPVLIADQLAISGLFGVPRLPTLPDRPTLATVRTALAQAWTQHARFTLGEYPLPCTRSDAWSAG